MTSAAERLAVADRLLREPELVERAVWPRACTWLIRLAVEHAIDGYWTHHCPELVSTNRRAQLIVLRHREPDVGPITAELWSRLSGAAHHHAYELAPTADELRAWHGEATRVVEGLVR
ncbi:hypothetical protein EV378_5350 [Pseudonocardia endophytica]|uniref:Uncharacterized protein n=1 Tax=Pseudonocardia endophytica TaxID=401976 RepID=A0A4R1HHX5_PSEEN|nr:hypothetical protein EV378_5350 [Pseudonocardia endophytica]